MHAGATMPNEDETVLLPILKQPAAVKSVPGTRRILTDRCLQSALIMRACWENGIDLPASQQHGDAGKPLDWDAVVVSEETADESSIGG